jgi:4-amino-4-deoxy-L-arabinose transferase-like glycosyltransferase
MGSFREAALARAPLIVFMIALGLRLAWVIYIQATHPGDVYYLKGDALEYSAVARNLISGEGWWSPDRGGGPYYHGPVFPLFVAGILTFGGSLFTVTLAHALIGALTCWGVVRLGRHITTPEGALAAGLAMAIYPYFFHYTALVLTETLSIFFGFLLFVALLGFSRDPSPLNAALAGIVLGLATLHHPETYVAPPLLLLWALAFHPRRLAATRGLALLLLVFGLAVLPWHAYHALRHDKSLFLPPGLDAGGVLAQGTLEAKGRVENDPAYFQGTSKALSEQGMALEKEHGALGSVTRAMGEVLGDLRANPGEYLRLVGLKFKRMWSLGPERGAYDRPWITIPTALLSAALYTGCLFGLFLLRRREEAFLGLVLIAVYTIPHLVFYAQPRYRLPVMPVVILFAGVACSALFERLSGRRRVPAGVAAADRGRGI